MAERVFFLVIHRNVCEVTEMNAVTASFNATVRQMTEMSQLNKKQS